MMRQLGMRDGWCRFLVLVTALGCLVRLIVAAVIEPGGADWHLGVVFRMASTGTIPLALDTDQSYHPPLYYLIATPLFILTARPRVVQGLSVLFSCGTVLVFAAMLARRTFVVGREHRRSAIMFLAFWPQLMLPGLIISNDSLAILWGALLALMVPWIIVRPNARTAMGLGSVLGLSLATKFSFLVHAGALIALLGGQAWHRSRRGALGVALLAIAVTLPAGGYKFAQNLSAYGRPVVSNVDREDAWVADQRAGRSWRSYVTLDPGFLWQEPRGTERRPYAELLYRTWWYEYLPLTTLSARPHWTSRVLGPVILTAALVPTGISVLGVVTIAARTRHAWRRARRPGRRLPVRLLAAVVQVSLLASLLALLVAAEWRYHIWSIMHARLLMTSSFALIPGWASGCLWIQSRYGRRAGLMATRSLTLMAVLFGCQLAVELLVYGR